MGARKAIVFSTHILEEVEAACTRAIIIDRGQIVANGTPAELKQRSEVAGAVTLRVGGVNASALGQKISQLSGARKTTVLKDEPSCVTARIYPQPNCRNGELARGIYETAAREGWSCWSPRRRIRRWEGFCSSVVRESTTFASWWIRWRRPAGA